VDADKIAVQSLIWTVVAAVAGVISAVAAVVAARYAKGSATQKSLGVVETNTASAAETITEVRSHLAKVEDHLRFQNDQHVLALLGQRASIRVYGEGWTDEPMVLSFIVATPQFVLTGIDLLNEGEVFSGNFICVPVEDGQYTASVPPTAFGQWFSSGTVQSHISRHVVSIRAHLSLGQNTTERRFSAIATANLRQGPESMRYYHTIEGGC
jgi:hypothetical protein